NLFPLLRQVRSWLLDRGSLIDIAHRQLRETVRRRYLDSEDARRAAHEALAAFFARQPLAARKVEELPWQLARAEAWDALYQELGDPAFFDAAWLAGSFEVKGYW